MLDRRFLDALSIGAYRCGLDGRVLAANTAASTMLAAALENLETYLTSYYVEPSEFERMAATLSEGHRATFRVSMRRADGSTFWTQHHAVLRKEPGLDELIIDGVFFDVTELAAAERKRDNALISLGSLIDNTPGVAVQIYDSAGLVQLWNPASETLYGYTSLEMIGRPMTEVLESENQDHFKQALAFVVRTRQPTAPSDFEVRTKGGSERHVWSTMFPLVLKNEEISVGCMDVDITERQVAMQRLETTRRKLVESERISHVGSWDWTIATDEVHWSEELCRIWGVPFNGGAARTYADFIAQVHPDDRERTVSVLKNTLDKGKSFAFEHRIIRPDGGIRSLLSRGELTLDADGTPVGLFGTVQDLTETRLVEAELKQREQHLRLVLDQMPAVLWSTDRSLTFLAGRGGALSSLNLVTDQLAGTTLYDYFGTRDPAFEPIAAHLRALEGQSASYQFSWNGRTFDTYVEPLRNQKGDVIGCVGVALDITDRVEANQALAVSEERYRTLFERNLAGVYRSTIDGRFLDCNEACARIFGYESREELLAHGASELHTDPSERERMIQRLRKTGTITNQEYEFRTRGGGTVWALESVTLFAGKDDSSSFLEGTLIDISDRKRAEEEIVRQAHHDALTGLPNRVLFRDRLTLALNHARRHNLLLAVLFLDLDHFKLINDTLGHTLGDQMLKGVAKRLSECVRDEDTVARVGGDEFTLLVPEIFTSNHADRIATKLLERFAEPFAIQGHELYISTSIGIAVYPNDGVTPETLLKNADSAMYRAKELGRNNYQMCTPAMTARALERLAVENGLRRAIERDELVLHYQPIVELQSGRVICFEALIRWQHPERGLLAPADFIAIAEESRLIIPLGQWVLQTACRQLRQWRSAGFETRMAINLSARQFQMRELPTMLDDVLRSEGIDASSIDLEITETTAMQNADLTVGILHQLTEMGVGIVIDDFGTGYSSLSYLKRFPISALKIDRSFVRDVTTTRSDAAIVAAVIATANALELRVVAEGVETEEQLELLGELHCKEAQGFLFGRPAHPGLMTLPRSVPLPGVP